MRSFAQHIGSKRTNNLADTAFKLMASRGVDPLRFVDWYATEGILFNEDEIPDQARQWLQQELLLVEGMAGNAARWLTGQAGHLIGKPWRALVGTGQAIGDVAAGAWHGMGDAAQRAGRDVDIAAGRTGIQKSPMCKTGFYDVESGHCVVSKDDKTPVDRNTGQPLPPQQAQQPGPMKNQQGGGNQQQGGGGGNQQGGGAHPLQGQIQQTHQALSALSKNMPQDLQQNNGFVMALQSLIGMLQQAPPAAQAPPPPPQQQQTAHYNPQLDSPFLQHVIVERKCRQVVNRLAEHGHDPRAFVEWYAQEGRYMSPHQFEGHVGDFFGNLWGGVKGMFGGKGWSHGWNQAISDRQAGVKQTAIQALMALQQQAQQLQGYGPDFMKHMNTVMQALGASTTPDQPDQSGGDGGEQDQQGDGGAQGQMDDNTFGQQLLQALEGKKVNTDGLQANIGKIFSSFKETVQKRGGNPANITDDQYLQAAVEAYEGASKDTGEDSRNDKSFFAAVDKLIQASGGTPNGWTRSGSGSGDNTGVGDTAGGGTGGGTGQHPADRGAANYDPKAMYGPKADHPANRGAQQYDPRAMYGPANGGNAAGGSGGNAAGGGTVDIEAEKKKPEAQSEDFWDAGKVAELRKQAAAGQGDPEVIKIHNDNSISDDERHKKIAAHMARQSRQQGSDMMASTHGSDDQRSISDEHYDFMQSILRHTSKNTRPRTWFN